MYLLVQIRLQIPPEAPLPRLAASLHHINMVGKAAWYLCSFYRMADAYVYSILGLYTYMSANNNKCV